MEEVSLEMQTLAVVLLLVICMTLAHPLSQRFKYVSESGMACLLGLLTGLIVLLSLSHPPSHLLTFDEGVFFTYLLPPIIFNAGLNSDPSAFFKNFPRIFLLGVSGTIVSFLIIAGGIQLTWSRLIDLPFEKCLAIGAIFAATDSVATLQVVKQDHHPVLYAVVFGEGVVNDATSVVLLRSIKSVAGGSYQAIALLFLYLLTASAVMGIAVGLGSAVLLRKMPRPESQAVEHEVGLLGLIAYVSYLLAESWGLSGIIALFSTGIIMSHYTVYNIREESQVTTRQAFKAISFISETAIFLFVGLDSCDRQKWQQTNGWQAFGLFTTLLLLLCLSRAVMVVPSMLCSNWLLSRRLSRQEIAAVGWAGLMRGAVSVALVYYVFTNHDDVATSEVNATITATTLLVVMFSILVAGALSKPLLEHLLPTEARPSSTYGDMEMTHGGTGPTSTEPLLVRSNSGNRLLERHPSFGSGSGAVSPGRTRVERRGSRAGEPFPGGAAGGGAGGAGGGGAGGGGAGAGLLGAEQDLGPDVDADYDYEYGGGGGGGGGGNQWLARRTDDLSEWWSRFDNDTLQPVFGGASQRGPVPGGGREGGGGSPAGGAGGAPGPGAGTPGARA